MGRGNYLRNGNLSHTRLCYNYGLLHKHIVIVLGLGYNTLECRLNITLYTPTHTNTTHTSTHAHTHTHTHRERESVVTRLTRRTILRPFRKRLMPLRERVCTVCVVCGGVTSAFHSVGLLAPPPPYMYIYIYTVHHTFHFLLSCEHSNLHNFHSFRVKLEQNLTQTAQLTNTEKHTIGSVINRK